MNSLHRRIDPTAVQRLSATLTISAAMLLGACTSSTHSTSGTGGTGSGSPAGSTVATSAASPTSAPVAGVSVTVPTTDAPTPVTAAVTGVSVTVPATDAPTPVTAAVTSPSSPPAGSPTGSPTDPCSLLSPDIAAAAIGAPVGDPKRATDNGNASCAYHAADPSVNRFVYLTTYAVVGSPSLLAAAAATFRDAESVPGLGDAADVSVQSQAVGVLVGTTVFALGVIQQNADGTLQLLTKDQLVAVAQAVLDGRS
ncbi:MAG: hypothetical protein JWM12_3720 [Ilumatobacteraceae bacterium]|nr:hypothetical protein [Ilumatobacteraceae bacterium]